MTAALVRYVETARRLGAAGTTLVATEPLRRARDAQRAIEDVARDSGETLLVLTPTPMPGGMVSSSRPRVWS